MSYFMFVFLVGLVLGLTAVASNPSPYYAALGLVIVAALACAALGGHGGAFLALILLLIYLGGMLVVFAYSAALAAEPYPEGWGSSPVVAHTAIYLGVIGLAYILLLGEWSEVTILPDVDFDSLSLFQGDMGGVALMYSSGGGMLLVSAWVLLLTLVVVLQLTRGLARGALRAV